MYERQFSQRYSSVTSKSTHTFNLLRQPVKTEQSFSRFTLFIIASLRALLKRLRPKLLVLQNNNTCIGAVASPNRICGLRHELHPRPQIRQQFSVTPNSIFCTDISNHPCCKDISYIKPCLLYRYQTIPVVQIILKRQ
jgi:hypothetical protein